MFVFLNDINLKKISDIYTIPIKHTKGLISYVLTAPQQILAYKEHMALQCIQIQAITIHLSGNGIKYVLDDLYRKSILNHLSLCGAMGLT